MRALVVAATRLGLRSALVTASRPAAPNSFAGSQPAQAVSRDTISGAAITMPAKTAIAPRKTIGTPLNPGTVVPRA